MEEPRDEVVVAGLVGSILRPGISSADGIGESRRYGRFIEKFIVKPKQLSRSVLTVPFSVRMCAHGV